MPEAKKTAVKFEGVTPILRVRSVAESIHYYTRVLGFKLDWSDPRGGFASVSRDRCSVFLCEGDQGHPGTWVWIGVEDVEVVLDEYRSRGAKIRHLPTNYEWAREMQIEDLDGNVLRIGSDSDTKQPIGEWLDMRGERWVRSPSGGWTRIAG